MGWSPVCVSFVLFLWKEDVCLLKTRGTLFSGRDLRRLLLPLIAELIFTALMGTADTVMVARVGDAAVSGVSLVDAVNNVMLMVFTATSTGGTIVCAQFLGARDRDGANRAARHVLLSVAAISALCGLGCVLLRRQILSLVFRDVEQSVMDAGLTYFLVTAISYPFIGVYGASAALYRAAGNSRRPMLVSAGGNLINIAGNAVFLFVFRWGVFGAALSTTLSRVLQCAVILWLHRKPGQVIVLDRYLTIRPDWKMIRMILRVGIPTGVENGMFQLGRLMVQSTVALLPTAEIAAQAMINTLEYFTSMPSMAIGLGLVTVAGRCMGAGKPEEARSYTILLTIYSELLVILTGILIYLAVKPVCALSGLSRESAEIVVRIMLLITVVKPFVWPLAFTPSNALRAAGDVKFSMLVSAGSMWVFRVVLCAVLIRYLGFGVLGVWIAMFVDWTDRAIWFTVRFVRGKWTRMHVLEPEM